MDSTKKIIEQRLETLNVSEFKVNVDYKNHRISVDFPSKNKTSNTPEKLIKEISADARLTFREGHEIDENGFPKGVTKSNIILEGKDIKKASPGYNDMSKTYIVNIELNSDGTKKFADATERLAGVDCISIWLYDECFSYPYINEKIPDGMAQISGDFTIDEIRTICNKINIGTLPFKLETLSLKK